MALDALASALRLPPMPFSTRLALRQLRYKGANLLGVFAGVCVAIVLVFVQIGFEQATVNSVLNFDRALRADLVIVGPQFEVIGYSPPWFNREVLYRAEGVPGVADARPLYMFVTQVRNWKGQQPLAARFTAFDPARPVLDLPRVNAQLDRLATPYSVLIDQKSRDDLGAFADRIARGEAPQSLYLQNAAADLAPRVDVVGAYSLGPDFTSFGAFLSSDLTFYRLFHFPLDRVSLGLVKLQAGQNPKIVRDAIAKAIGADAKVYTHKQFIDIERNYFVYRTPVGVVFLSGIGIGVVIGTVFVLNMLHGIIDSNLSEYAVLRAMGYRDKFFRSLVLQIATLITSVAFVPSVVATLAIYASLAHATRLPFALTVPQAILVFCASLVMSMAAALLAIRKLRTSNPLELFS